MPRGSKTCTSCGKVTGPRSWNCPGCGAGFVVRGVQKPDMSVTAKPARSAPEQRLWSLVGPATLSANELTQRARHGITGKIWESECGQYRISENKTFMGIDMTEHYSKCVRLLVRMDYGWKIVRPKGKFKTPLAALKRLHEVLEGKKPKATTQKQLLEVRVAKKLKKEPAYC